MIPGYDRFGDELWNSVDEAWGHEQARLFILTYIGAVRQLYGLIHVGLHEG